MFRDLGSSSQKQPTGLFLRAVFVLHIVVSVNIAIFENLWYFGQVKKIYIYGKHAVREALMHAPGLVKEIHISPQMDDDKIRELIRKLKIPTSGIDVRKVSSQVERGAPHQGVIALISLTALAIPFEKFIEGFTPAPDSLLVVISEVQDPHNVGAIIRSAAAFGAAAVLMPTHKQAPITGTAIKVSAGMAFRVPLVTMENMQQALGLLKKKGVHIYGLEAGSENSISDEQFGGPTVLVLGNEAEGLTPAARALCEKMLSIPIDARAESLNVAASAAVALYSYREKITHPHID